MYDAYQSVSVKGFRVFSLGTLGAKNGIEILVDLDPGGHAREFGDTPVELGEDFIIQFHDFLHCLFSDCYGRFLQPCH